MNKLARASIICGVCRLPLITFFSVKVASKFPIRKSEPFTKLLKLSPIISLYVIEDIIFNLTYHSI